MSLLLIHGTVKRSLEMKTVMRFTKVKEKIIKNKPINSTDEGKGRHRKVIRIGAFALVFVVLFSFVSTFFKMTDAVNIATIEGFYKEPKNTIDVMMIVGKYLESNNDYINLMKSCKRYHDLVDMYHYNLIGVVNFENMETQHKSYKDIPIDIRHTS